MHKVRIVIAAVALTALASSPALPAGAAPASASPTDRVLARAVAQHRIHWEPYRSEPLAYTNGECPFPVTSTPVADQEQKATAASYADGSPRLELYRGELKVRFTNTTNGHSRVVDLSGRGALQYQPDGSQIFFMDGPVGVGIRPTDHYRTGIWLFDGIHVLYTAPQRADRRVLFDDGTEQNLCPLIS